MNEINKKEIYKAVRKAYKEGSEWCKHDFGRYFKIMLDTYDAEIWVDEFVDINNWKQYRSDTIKYLQCNTSSNLDRDIEEAYTEDAIHQLKKAGWIIK